MLRTGTAHRQDLLQLSAHPSHPPSFRTDLFLTARKEGPRAQESPKSDE